MIIIDGQEIPGTPDDDPVAETLRVILLELKLCRALAAFSPPPELAAPLHARIAAQLRKLGHHGTADPGARRARDLTDAELQEAVTIVRAIRALPTWGDMNAYGSGNVRGGLGGYALDLIDEISKRSHPERQAGA
jgi:hypothetical protein